MDTNIAAIVVVQYNKLQLLITTISELKGNELIKNIRDGIIRKLDSARLLVHYDKEMAAGVYTYAIEEFGKLPLIKEARQTNNAYKINTD
jgi:hypothetical protein